MEKPGFNCVRTLRQRTALTQRELAFLISRSQTTVSSMEYGDTTPYLDAALALQVLFRLPPKELFSRYYEQVEDAVMARAADLIRELEDSTDRRSLAKLEFLENLPREDNDIRL